MREGVLLLHGVGPGITTNHTAHVHRLNMALVSYPCPAKQKNNNNNRSEGRERERDREGERERAASVHSACKRNLITSERINIIELHYFSTDTLYRFTYPPLGYPSPPSPLLPHIAFPAVLPEKK